MIRGICAIIALIIAVASPFLLHSTGILKRHGVRASSPSSLGIVPHRARLLDAMTGPLCDVRNGERRAYVSIGLFSFADLRILLQ
jgi:hypothetical protein